MKNTIKLLALLVALVSLFNFLVSCDNGGNGQNNNVNEPMYTDYCVKIIDGIGNPVSNVIVKFVSADGTSKTRVTEADGIAQLKNVLAGEYKITVEQGFSDAIIEQSEYTLTAENRDLTIIVRDGNNTFEIYGEVPEGTYAYNVDEGNYSIPSSDEMTYLVFYAQSSGIYNFSITSDDPNATVGFYGIPMFVQSTHRGDGEYDGKKFEIIIHDTATPYLIGVKSVSAVANFKIERVGDAPFDPQYVPWTVIPASGEIASFTLPAGTILTDINISDPGLSVALGDDGYYYTSDGKLVYLRISSISTAKYLDVSIAFIAGLVDQNFGQNFGGYVYDENGNFVGKYSYNSMIEAYYEKCDSNGVYPLTAELAEAIQCHGNSSGWWDSKSGNYLFTDTIIDKDNAWLFLCCTAN